LGKGGQTPERAGPPPKEPDAQAAETRRGLSPNGKWANDSHERAPIAPIALLWGLRLTLAPKRG